MEVLFRAYITEGRDLGHTPTLPNVATAAGLDRGRATKWLRGEEGVAEVYTAEEHARRLGVQGVPFFVINGEIMLSGARGLSPSLKPSAGLRLGLQRRRLAPISAEGEDAVGV
jgi:predicted DsbA family dithiol-disulfide isomerase